MTTIFRWIPPLLRILPSLSTTDCVCVFACLTYLPSAICLLVCLSSLTLRLSHAGSASGPSSFVLDCCGVLPVPCPAALSSDASGGWQRNGRGCYVVSTSQQLLSSRPSPLVVAHMYAIGDCCAAPVVASKLAYTAELQAVVAAANVAQQLQRGVDAAPLLTFPLSLSVVLPAPTLICCSLGAWDGVLVFNDIVVGGWLAALAKLVIERSKVGQYRGQLASGALWAIGEPMTFALNRLYHAIADPLLSWHSQSQRRHNEHTT